MDNEILIRLLADFMVLPIIALAAWALIVKIPKNKRYQAYCRILLAGLSAFLLAKLAGLIYQPEVSRPYELLGITPGASYLDNPGFPSDHALFVTAITLAVWFETKDKVITLILVALSVLVCLGRVLALVHTPLDVVAGVLIALMAAVWYKIGAVGLAKAKLQSSK